MLSNITLVTEWNCIAVSASLFQFFDYEDMFLAVVLLYKTDFEPMKRKP